MSKAAQGFSLRRTIMYVTDGNPRRTPLIEKGTIYEGKLRRIYGKNYC
jgi:hypothetical protein